MDFKSTHLAQESRRETANQNLRSEYSFPQKLRRAAWGIVWLLLFRISPTPAFGWRRMLLRFFGAGVGKGARVYNSVKFFDPRNVDLGESSTIGPCVNMYSVGLISIGKNAIVSQGSHLCAASHDYTTPRFALIRGDIRIGNEAWVCADAFIGTFVKIGDCSIVAARGVVTKDVDKGTIVGGNPARVIGERTIKS